MIKLPTLDVVENIEGKADKANDAEILVVDNMQRIGAIALQEWAVQRDKAVRSGSKNIQ